MKAKTQIPLALLFIISLGLLISYWVSEPVRTAIKWTVLSRTYKNEISVLPTAKGVYLKHIEWDTWGGFGAGDTTMYLVADPENTLSAGATGRETADVLPCDVSKVRKLEDGWYTVLFYTDTDWENCPTHHSSGPPTASTEFKR